MSKRVPDLKLQVKGYYLGNPYPDEYEFEVRFTDDLEDKIGFVVENSSGSVIGTSGLNEDEIDGLLRVQMIDHGLDEFRDDSALPPGLERIIQWQMPTYSDYSVVLDSGQIDEVCEWLLYATGAKNWDFEEMGEEWEW